MARCPAVVVGELAVRPYDHADAGEDAERDSGCDSGSEVQFGHQNPCGRASTTMKSLVSSFSPINSLYIAQIRCTTSQTSS